MELDVKNVSKKYGKGKYGLKDFSLSMGKGVLGLLGPNGAGKSTLLKMLATVNRPTQGMIVLNKNNIVKDPNYMRGQLGFLPQDFGVYPNLNAYEFLTYMAAMKGVGGAQLKPRISKLLEGLNLLDAAKRPIGSYSGGMRQRVGIAQALLNDPKVIIFDEPTVGLDPEARVRFKQLVADLAHERIVILSSHIVSDIDTISDTVAILKKGALIIHGNQRDIIAPVAQKVFEVTIEKEGLAHLRKAHIIVGTSQNEGRLTVRYISDAPLEHSTMQRANLEDAYLYAIKKKD
ncbi:MAG: ABC transporter ATP-binding protein [Flavobacteriaceae bacterium]